MSSFFFLDSSFEAMQLNQFLITNGEGQNQWELNVETQIQALIEQLADMVEGMTLFTILHCGGAEYT